MTKFEPIRGMHLKSIVIENGDPIPWTDFWKDMNGGPLWMQVTLKDGQLRVTYLSPFGRSGDDD